jgi:hypothetical protein
MDAIEFLLSKCELSSDRDLRQQGAVFIADSCRGVFFCVSREEAQRLRALRFNVVPDGEIVVSADYKGGVLANPPNHLARLGTVTHEIAQAPYLVDAGNGQSF